MDYYVIGIMSGSSLDGLDICLLRLQDDPQWSYEIEKYSTCSIPLGLKHRLQKADQLDSYNLSHLNFDYGVWIGEELGAFLSPKLKEQIQVIGLHGHTVFHDPTNYLSLQIGSGALVSIRTGIPVVDNFRSRDILLGGQGAPLVPMGERYLFAGFQGFVNLGGIANVSIHQNQVRAWDVAPCNQVFNALANRLNLPFDNNGELASKGKIDKNAISDILELPYFKQPPPKSLSNQWTQKILDILEDLNPIDALHTYSRFLASQIIKDFSDLTDESEVLITGGGAWNNYLIELLQNQNQNRLQLVIPNKQVVDYKEALIFGFLAHLRIRNMPNVLASVTGANNDSVSGDLHLPLSE